MAAQSKWNSGALTKYFPGEHIAHVRERYSDGEIELIMGALSANHIKAIEDPEDYLCTAVVSNMMIFQCQLVEQEYEIKDIDHFRRNQRELTRRRKEYLRQELERTPTSDELASDILAGWGLRNRVFYILKHRTDETKVKSKLEKAAGH